MKKSQHTSLYRKLVMELKVARVRAGLTQLEAAQRLKAYKTYVSKVEAAERKIDVIELAELCRLYGVSVADFLKEIPLE